jgi:hypothetical protein
VLNTVFTTPDRIRDPPCDDRGGEIAPMVFHISDEVMRRDFANAYRPGVMARWYENLTVRSTGGGERGLLGAVVTQSNTPILTRHV